MSQSNTNTNTPIGTKSLDEVDRAKEAPAAEAAVIAVKFVETTQ